MIFAVVSVDSEGVASLLTEREWEKLVGISDEMSLAASILQDANMLDEERVRLLHACELDGRSPVDFARRLVKLNAALRT